ncbi:MAG TPA: hypothetical protein VMI32_07025 [Candidatus Solibacter sp.]|nr:hypothetical protein [Candidatus Solibacter sp.]
MKRKPENIIDAIRTALAVEKIGLLPERYFPKQKLALVAVASWWGQPICLAIVAKATNVKTGRAIRKILESLVALDMLKPEHKVSIPGAGARTLSYWPLNFEHPNFPEYWPGYSEEKKSRVRKHGDLAAGEKAANSPLAKSARAAGEIEGAAGEFRIAAGENADKSPTLHTTPLLHQPTIQPTNPGSRMDGKAWWKNQTLQMGRPSKENIKVLESLEKTYGPEKLDAMLASWKQRPQGWKDLKARWHFFIQEHEAHTGAPTASQIAEENKAQEIFDAQQVQAQRAQWLPGEKREYAEILDAIVAGTYVAPEAPPEEREETEADFAEMAGISVEEYRKLT